MKIRQLRYFVYVVKHGSLGGAARELGLVTSTLSQQISRLESELSTRLLMRTTSGVTPTDAGIAFFRRAQLALRHLDEAARAAQQARLSGYVSVGLAPTTSSVIGLPLVEAMRERYPDIRLHLVESLSGHLANMLNSRQLDLAILFNAETGHNWSVIPLLEEHLYVIAVDGFKGFRGNGDIRLQELGDLPLAMPTHLHSLRSVVASAVQRENVGLNIVLEIDSLAMLMETVAAGLLATVQPGIAILRSATRNLAMARIVDPEMKRRNLLASLSEDELSPAALAARTVIRDLSRSLVQAGRWIGAQSLHDS